jgi:hypothetical protein
MDEDVRRVIVESIDAALSSFDYVDKEKFLNTLKSE